ncbi:MAG TPA: hypothetical protein VFS57_08540 [Gemmatimonadaceae bacterium]|nr:hypothetical protein [Gemmatimonadaceae bacterium]
MRSLAMLSGLMLVPCALAAQRTGSAAAGQVAGIAAPVVRAERIVAPPPGSFLIGGVPVVVLSDGRMFADFGYGYEPITRGCGGAVLFVQSAAIPVQPAVVQPTVAQPSAGVSERLRTRRRCRRSRRHRNRCCHNKGRRPSLLLRPGPVLERTRHAWGSTHAGNTS